MRHRTMVMSWSNALQGAVVPALTALLPMRRGKARRTAVVCVTSVLCTLWSSSVVLPRVLTAIAAERSVTLAWLCRTLCLQLLSSGAAAATVRIVEMVSVLVYQRAGQALLPSRLLHVPAITTAWSLLSASCYMPKACLWDVPELCTVLCAGADQAFHSIAAGEHGRDRVGSSTNMHSGASASAIPGL